MINRLHLTVLKIDIHKGSGSSVSLLSTLNHSLLDIYLNPKIQVFSFTLLFLIHFYINRRKKEYSLRFNHTYIIKKEQPPTPLEPQFCDVCKKEITSEVFDRFLFFVLVDNKVHETKKFDSHECMNLWMSQYVEKTLSTIATGLPR